MIIGWKNCSLYIDCRVERCDELLAEILVERIALKSDDFCGDDFQLKALARGV